MTEPVATPIRIAQNPAPEESAGYGTRAEWVAAGRSLSGSASDQSWAFADWLAVGEAAWGRDALREAAAATGATPGKISHYLTTARAWPPLRRRKSLAFSHHLEVARLPEADAARLLDTAQTEGWSRAETRAAAREASLEAKNARLRRENAELKRALAASQADPRDAARQARSRLGAEHRVVRDAAGRSADLVEEILESGVLDGLHGNARRGLVRDIKRSANALVDTVNAAVGRIETAARRMEEPPA